MKKNKYNTEDFIEKSKLKHGDKYDYSKVEYRYLRNFLSVVKLYIDDIDFLNNYPMFF